MDVTQSFRLSGQTDTEEIPCNHINGQTIIYWDDIELVFPGVKRVKCGNVSVSPLRDSNENRIEPYRIKHYPDTVLEVILSTSDGNGLGTNRRNIGHTNEDNTVESQRTTHQLADTTGSDDNRLAFSVTSTHPSQSRSSEIEADYNATLSLQVAHLEQKKSTESKTEQRLVTSLPSHVQARVRTSIDVHSTLVQVINEGLVNRPNEQLVECLQELKDKMNENNELACKNNEMASRIMDLVSENKELTTRLSEMQEEMRELQIQALDRLALLHNSVKALLTQTYELHEYPIPRLFIVLPKNGSSWNPVNLLSNRFRLYFLCECGEHTKSTNSKIPHHIHLAKHEGYDISSPKEFFRQYGSYVLTILRMLKFGISVTGVVVPAVSLLVRDDTFNKAASSLKMSIGNISSGMDQMIHCIVNVSANEGVAERHLEQMNNNEALEGADLRQLETFLKNKDKNKVMGDLYRTVTTEGHVKWVCIDHYRENYHEKTVKAFRDTVDLLKGSFNENIGRVEVKLQSRAQAEQFYLALEKAKSVYELRVTFDNDWDTTQSDFKRLRDALGKSNVGVLDLNLTAYTLRRTGYLGSGMVRTTEDTDGPTSDILNRNQRYDPIFDIMRHPSIQSVSIRNTPLNFVKRSSLQSRNDDFPNLRHLSIDVGYLRGDIASIKSLVAKASNLSSLTFYKAEDQLPHIYNAIAEHQTCPIAFRGQSLRILPPMDKSFQSTNDLKDRADLLRVLGGRIESVVLTRAELDDTTVAGFAKAIERGSSLKELSLREVQQHLSDQCIKDLASIVARSELRSIYIYLETERGVPILESIQWEHLRELEILVNREGMETHVMKALIDGAKKLPDGPQLEAFKFYGLNQRQDSLFTSEQGLLQAFLSSTSVKVLRLKMGMTPEQMLSLLSVVDFSRTQELCLWPEGFDFADVDVLLNGLEHATELRYIGLKLARITDEQKERMKARGVRLTDHWNVR
ncbi:hypothetical protein BGX34_011307 [Mortierella sp. NVP85]|nr:hypothetical protein BGX34_011307 [Mortierella sp. NVP85]